ncbi:MAG: PH domain-containing protein [Salinibacterium sp.]|nr:PH domain-containing protein [Salinibacterium sp.]
MAHPVPTGAAQEAEHLVASLHSHRRALFWPTLVLVSSVGAMTYLYGNLPLAWQNLAVLVAGGLVILLLWLLPLLAWLGRRYTITTRRIVLRRGFIVRARQELLHSRGYDITVRKNALQSMFGSGDVRINTGLDHPVVLKDVPNADLIQSALHDLMERSINPIAARRQAAESSVPDETIVWEDD